MQTFLPYPDFTKSAQCLDRQRLGKQRVECMQIAKALLGETKGWANHPATKMWKGYESALFAYWANCVKEWLSRGYKDTTMNTWHELQTKYGIDKIPKLIPPWLGDIEFHLSHQSNLVRKFPEHYKTYFPYVPDDLPYIWPKSNF